MFDKFLHNAIEDASATARLREMIAVLRKREVVRGMTPEKLRQVLTAKGRSYSDPVYNADGSVNMDASRRVEFKFRLKDSEMIDEMRQILTTGDQ